MPVTAFEGIVENGQIRLTDGASLPEGATVYVLVPEPTTVPVVPEIVAEQPLQTTVVEPEIPASVEPDVVEPEVPEPDVVIPEVVEPPVLQPEMGDQVVPTPSPAKIVNKKQAPAEEPSGLSLDFD